MKGRRTRRILLACAVGVAAFAAPEAHAQRPGDCTLPQEDSGLIRGDRVPRGCVLESEPEHGYTRPGTRGWRTPLGPCEEYAERIFHTPHPKRSVLLNAVRICLPKLHAADPLNLRKLDDAELQSLIRNFGSRTRPFGPIDRDFGSRPRHFGTLERPFGSRQRPFPNTGRRFEPDPDSRG